MKFCAKKFSRRHVRFQSGFTLAEMLVSSTIFLVIIVSAMISVQLYGMRVYVLATTKINATTSGRESINDIRDRIRSASQVYVGIYTNFTFTTNTIGQPQKGNAIQIYATTNTTPATAIVFYQDPTGTNITMRSNTTYTVEANFVTNYYCFQAQDYQGNILTNYVNNAVIDVTLMFNQYAFPVAYGGTVYDYYRLHTRVALRNKN